MIKVILASASPRRKQLLKNIFQEFTIIPADVDENISENISVKKRPEKIAEKKAEFVARENENCLVIGCDTAVIVDDIMLGKPKDIQDAVNMIKMLSGRSHSVITGCSLFYKGKSHSFSNVTQVEFYKLTENEITEYINAKEPENTGSLAKYQWEDKAGGYGIQGSAGLLVKSIIGDYNNVVGLPCAQLKREIDLFLKNYKDKL